VGIPPGTQTPFSRAISSMWKGSPWKVDTTHASFITAGNSGETPVAANMALISSDGKFRYELPERTLAPDEQIWVDVRELIRNRVPDRNGKVLPADMTTGTYEIWQTKYRALGQLFEGKLIVDKTYGHAMYGCGGCCGLGDSYQVLDPYQDIIGGTHYQQVWGQNGCNGGYYDVTSDVWMWTSYSTDVASVSDGGMVTGLAPGGATIESRVNTEIGPRCEPIEILQYAQVEVQPTVTLTGSGTVLSRNTGYTSGVNSTTLVANGSPSGGTYSWSVSNSKIGLSSNSGDTVTATGQTPSTSRNDVTVTVTYNLNGVSNSATLQMTVLKPSGLVASNIVQLQEGSCPVGSTSGCGTTKLLDWTVFDQWGSAIAVAGIDFWDSISTTSPNTCFLGAGSFATTCSSAGLTNSGPCNQSTNSSGSFSDTYSLCSTACRNSSGICTTGCSTGASQTYYLNGFPTQKALTYACDSISVPIT
jgi:hypothetical protein